MTELFRPRQPAFTPSARAVDTYSRPSRDAAPQRPSRSNALLDLAGALKGVQPTLNKYFDKRHEEYVNEEDASGKKAWVEGEINALETNRQGFRELIDGVRKTDPARADELAAMSPHFKRGYMKARLDSLGMVYEDHILTQWGQNPEIDLPDGTKVNLQQTDDPMALQQWMNDQGRQFMEDQDIGTMDPVLVAEAFLPRFANANQALSGRHGQHRLQLAQQEYADAFSQNLQMVLGGIVSTGATEEGMTAIQARLDSAIADGLTPRKANELLVDSLINTARQSRNVNVLDILKSVDTGNGPLSNVGWVRDKISAADEAIQNRNMTLQRHAWAAEAHQRQVNLDKIMTDVVPKLLTDRSMDLTEVSSKLIASGNYGQALQLQNTQDSLLRQENSVLPDHDKVSALRARIYDAQTDDQRRAVRDDILAGINNDEFDAGWATRLFDDLDRAGKNKSSLDDPYLRGWGSDIQTRIDKRFYDEIGKTTYSDVRGLEAKMLLSREYVDWVTREEEEGRIPSESERRQKIDEIGSAILKSPRFEFDPGSPNDVSKAPLHTPKAQESLGIRPSLNTIQTLVDARPGEVTLSADTLPQSELSTLLVDHTARKEKSALSQIARNQDVAPWRMVELLSGIRREDAAPAPEPVTESPADIESPVEAPTASDDSQVFTFEVPNSEPMTVQVGNLSPLLQALDLPEAFAVPGDIYLPIGPETERLRELGVGHVVGNQLLIMDDEKFTAIQTLISNSE